LSLGISMDETGTVSDESFGEDQPFVLAFINPETDVAKALGMSVQEIRNSLRSARAKLLLARETRQPVSVDDKVVADWNGLTISAFARAGRVLGMPGFVEAASRAADFGLARMMNGKGVLMHSYKDGTSSVPGFLEDYASMARGLFELYQSSHEVRFLSSALQLIDRMVELFRDDADGGFFQVGTHGEQMVVRVKPVYDGALPSGNAVAAEVLAVASRLTERSDLDGVLRHLFAAVGASVAQSPSQHVSLLMGHRLHSGDMRVTVVTGEVTSGETQRLLRAAAQVYAPDNYLVLLPSGKAGMLVQTVLPVARDHPLGGAQSVAYVCTRTSCAEPLTEPIRLSAQLK
ncbi:MAG: thioredoxin domain-containing protein, partial [Dehalococcoidia bacterium]|nr:thioredoxin domain-containing protein [Dehalococcoidia bacterium]